MITNSLLLDWAILSASIFNIIVMLWLGATVLLNAKRRTLGVWIMGLGLVAGASFFVIHTAILGNQLILAIGSLNLWWRIGWVCVNALPFSWYLAALWYGGYWNEPPHPLRRRHHVWLWVMAAQTIIMGLLIAVANPMPTYIEMLVLDLSDTIAVFGIPLLFVVFPIQMILNLVLAIDVLLHPEPTGYAMGDAGREQARPWLFGTSAILLIVSLLVTGFIGWVSIAMEFDRSSGDQLLLIGLFDLVLQAIIALGVIMLGQAIVSYEVFTGTSLPRRGFLLQWMIIVLVAMGYSIVIGGSLASQTREVYSLLLTTLVVVAAFALFSWQSFVERDRYIASLRPFVRSQRLMNHIIDVNQQNTSRIGEFFEAVCRDVLSTQRACLIPKGILSPLVNIPLTFPPQNPPPELSISADAFAESDVMTLNPEDCDGYCWAVPLWAERGLIGIFLLGEKSGGGLYSQEEIHIAQSSGERIVDALAGEEMARRLIALQRRRLVINRVMDNQTRRALHDNILPDLHMAVLQLNALPDKDSDSVQQVIQTLSNVHSQISGLIHAIPDLPAEMNGTDLARSLSTMIDTEFAGEFNRIDWHVDDAFPQTGGLVQTVLIGAVHEAVRNAAVHGRGDKPNRPLNLSISLSVNDDCTITVEDDGIGLDYQPSREQGGAGGGLALHSTLMALIGGYLTIEPAPEEGTRVQMVVPIASLAPSE